LAPEKEPLERATKRKILHLLDKLRQTSAGGTLYRHVEGLLGDLEYYQLQTEEAYYTLLRNLLDKVADGVPADPALRTQLKLTQLSIASPATAMELMRLAQALDDLTGDDSDQAPGMVSPAGVEQALHHLIHDLGLESGTAAIPDADRHPAAGHEQGADESAVPVTPPPEAALQNDQNGQVESQRQRFQEVQKTLTQQVTEVMKQNEEFGVFLEVELEALRQAGAVKEVDTLRQMLCKEVEKLLSRHRSLAAKLDRSYSYLQIIETDSQLLTDELTRVHLLSLTDELTGLPNRRAFTRRLEDEVARVQRYGYPLSLALIDLDGFKAVNDAYGHPAGDEVLRTFATSILSMFRHHDMVSRYGGEEFAVLLPNTDVEGAMRALRKVQRRAAETTFKFNGSSMPMPTFSAGLALYKPGETPGNLIERADTALYRAKRLGRNRIEQGSHDGPDRPTKN
jgi:diguanylate cyclase